MRAESHARDDRAVDLDEHGDREHARYRLLCAAIREAERRRFLRSLVRHVDSVGAVERQREE